MKIKLNITPEKAKAMIELGLFGEEIKEQINAHFQAFQKVDQLISFLLLQSKPLQTQNSETKNISLHFHSILTNKDVEKYVLSELSEERRVNLKRLAGYYLDAKEFLEIDNKQKKRDRILKDVSFEIQRIKEQ